MGGGGWSREENNGFTEEEAYWSFLKNNLPKIWKKKIPSHRDLFAGNTPFLVI